MSAFADVLDSVDYREMVNPAALAGLTIYSGEGVPCVIEGADDWCSHRYGEPYVRAIGESYILRCSVWCINWTAPEKVVWRDQGAAGVETPGQRRARLEGAAARGVWASDSCHPWYRPGWR